MTRRRIGHISLPETQSYRRADVSGFAVSAKDERVENLRMFVRAAFENYRRRALDPQKSADNRTAALGGIEATENILAMIQKLFDSAIPPSIT